jgi:hypothetical protein
MSRVSSSGDFPPQIELPIADGPPYLPGPEPAELVAHGAAIVDRDQYYYFSDVVFLVGSFRAYW